MMISEDSFQHILLDADGYAAGPPVLKADAVIAAVRHKQHLRKCRRILAAGISSIAALVLIAGLVWIRHDRNKQLQIARLQTEIQFLNQRLDTTMAMIQEAMEIQRQQDKLTQLENQLAQYSDYEQKRDEQEENTALTILIQADRLQNASLQQDAQSFYKRILELYPNTYWAQIARQKLQSKDETIEKGNTL